ncbi:AbrB/MazE/SpoVT family DNA-binding domain-containing protein [Haloechinothrix sp. LS1_15]|nr:AbrB/MazE/SpoVT family DNA-binding domain-containing protein [Haloechinothrix sp. LS1_15]
MARNRHGDQDNQQGGQQQDSKQGKAFYGPGGRGFYGSVTVSERGQVVIPAQARRDLGIGPGDKLLVLADPEQGLALVTIELLMRNLHGSTALFEEVRKHVHGENDEGGPGDDHGDRDSGGGDRRD